MSLHSYECVHFLWILRRILTTDKVRQSRLSKLRDKRNQLSDRQWEDVLRSTLLQSRINIAEASDLEKLEVLAILVGDQLSITFRNNVSGITQKLGEVVFEKDENQELDIIRWAGTAVERSSRLDREVQDLTSKYDEQSEKMELLNHQLEDLIKAKMEHEDSLLQKFRELLNTKKLKIRDQQRLLASAKLDPKQAAKLQSVRSTSKPYTATASRAGKRKAETDHGASESSEESGFEEKAAKEKPESDRSETTNTSEHSDQDVTEDESGDDPESAHQVATLPDGSEATDAAKESIGERMQSDILPATRDPPSEEGGWREPARRPVKEDDSTLTLKVGNEDEETDDDEL